MSRGPCAILFALVNFLAAPAIAAEPDIVTTQETRWWVGYMSNWMWHPRWSVWFDTHYDHGRFGVLRTGISHHLPAGPTATAGYAQLFLNPGDGSLSRLEYRPWAQIVFPSKIGERWGFSQRVRSDFRFREPTADGEVVGGELMFTWRMRYSTSLVRTLARLPFGSVFVQVYNEVLVDFGPDAPANRLNQNRLAALLGLRVGGRRFRVGYMDRYLPSGDGTAPRHEHTLIVWFNQTIRFGKAKRAREAVEEPRVEDVVAPPR